VDWHPAAVATVAMDRLKGSMRALVRGAIPEILYTRTWRAKMVLQRSSLRVDAVPYDTRLPPMANIPLKVGIPGVEVKIAPGHDVAVGWEDARPDRPFATLWTAGAPGASPVSTATLPLRVALHALLVELGGDGILPLLPTDGVLTGLAIDPFTGAPHFALGNASTRVMARKV
jgi:hypothetical protein